MKLIFIYGFVLFTMSAIAGSDYLNKWMAGDLVSYKVEGQSQDIQVFRRIMFNKKYFFTPADIILNRIPKAPGEGWVSPDNMIKDFDRGLGVKTWIKKYSGTDVYFEGQNDHVGKAYRIYFSQSDKNFYYSIANYRIGYSDFLAAETLQIQRAIGNKDLIGFKRKSKTVYKRIKEIVLLSEAYAQSSSGPGQITSLSELTEEDIVQMINGMKGLSALGGQDLANAMKALGNLGNSLSGLGSGISSFTNSGLFKSNPALAIGGAVVAGKVINKLLNMVADGIINGSIQGAVGLFNILSGKNKRENENKAFEDFYKIKSDYDAASEAIYKKTRELNEFIFNFKKLLGPNESLEKYLEGASRFTSIGLGELEKQQKDLTYRINLAKDLKSGKITYMPTPQDLNSVSVLSEEIYELCKDELLKENDLKLESGGYRATKRAELKKLLEEDPQKKPSDFAYIQKQIETGLTKSDMDFKVEPYYNNIIGTSSCEKKIIARTQQLREEYILNNKKMMEDDMAKLDSCEEELSQVESTINMVKAIDGHLLKDVAAGRDFCTHIRNYTDQLFAEEAKLDKFRRDLIELYPGMKAKSAREAKKGKPIEPDKDDKKILSSSLAEMKAKVKLSEKSISESLNKFSKNCKKNEKMYMRCEKITKQYEEKLIQPHYKKLNDELYSERSFKSMSAKEREDKSVTFEAEMQVEVEKMKAELSIDQDGEWVAVHFENLNNSLSSYRTVLRENADIVARNFAELKTIDYREGETSSAEISSSFMNNLDQFIKRVESDRTGYKAVINDDGQGMKYLKSSSRALDQLHELKKKKKDIDLMCK